MFIFLFYDIDRLIIGESSYMWRKEDLRTSDDRINEIDHLMGGFDYGNFTP